MIEEKSKIYIAGPMTGYPDLNFPAFFQAEEEIKDFLGDLPALEIVNPARLDIEGASLLDIIEEDISNLLQCNKIYMLKGWEYSVGARAEHAIAAWMGIDIYYQDQD